MAPERLVRHISILVNFLLIKYLSLAMLSARALLLAALLGPVSYGVLGTLVLIQQYLSYTALGVREGLTVKLAQSHGDANRITQICSSAIFWAGFVGTLLFAGSLVIVFGIKAGNSNWIYVAVIAAFSITNEMFININRDQANFIRVAFLELLFNCTPLLAALVFFRSITVTIALMSLVAGVILSVVIYAHRMRDFRWSAINFRTTTELLAAGIPLALVSFAMTSLSAVFVFSANAMQLSRTVGLIVFANSMCVVLLFGLNTVAWAATSRSMRRLHQTNSDEQGAKPQRLTMFLRLGVIVSPAILLCSKFVFVFFMHAYLGSEIFAVYLCLLQAYGLLLFREINYLAVRFRSLVFAICYGVMLLTIAAIAIFFSRIGLVAVLQISVVLMFLFSLGFVAYCRHLGFADRDIRVQVLFLLFPVVFAVAYSTGAALGGAVIGLVYVAFWVGLYKKDLRSLFACFPGG